MAKLIMDHGSKMRCMDQEYLCGPQDRDSKVTTSKDKSMAKADYTIMMDHASKVSGKMAVVKGLQF